MKPETKELMKQREYCKKYRQQHLNKDKKFFSVRFEKELGEEIKTFMKEKNIPIKQIIEEGTEILWKELG